MDPGIATILAALILSTGTVMAVLLRVERNTNSRLSAALLEIRRLAEIMESQAPGSSVKPPDVAEDPYPTQGE